MIGITLKQFEVDNFVIKIVLSKRLHVKMKVQRELIKTFNLIEVTLLNTDVASVSGKD